MSQGTKQFPTRIPVALHAALAAAATENNRSLNAEVIYRLDQTFQENPDCPPVPVDLLVTAAAEALGTVVTEVITTCFTKLEERILQKMAPEMLITSVHIDASHMSKEDIDKMGAGFIAEELKPFYSAASPTGRLSKSQPELQEISGLNTLPQAMRRHGGCAFTGLPTGEEPQLLEKGEQVLTIPGALEWDRPGEETDWRVHDGLNPIGLCISADTIVEVERRDGVKLPADRAGDFNWVWDASLLPGKDPAEIYAWRLVPGQAEYPEGWIENTGSRPLNLRPDQLIETKTRPHGLTHRRLVGDTPGSWWVTASRGLPVIMSWRLAR